MNVTYSDQTKQRVEDYLLLAFEIFLFKTRVRNQVGEQINRFGKRGIRNLCGETSHLMGRIGIQVPPQTVGFDGDIASAAARSAFEHGMLDKMADPVQFGRFVT